MATELRDHLQKSIEGCSDRNRAVRAWNRLSPEAKREALLAAFPAETYCRRLPPNGRMN